MNKPYLTSKKACEFARCVRGVDLKPSRIRYDAFHGRGPQPVAKFGRSYLFTEEEILRYVDTLITPMAMEAA
jgi:hypothetical protein